MAELFQNKYRIETARARWWNYGQEGAYFVTICCHHHRHFFGKVVEGEMQLSAAGQIALEHWKAIPRQFPYALLDAFVIMPNHIHGVVAIRPELLPGTDAIDRVSKGLHQSDPDIREDAINRVSTENIDQSEPDTQGGITGEHNPMLQANLSRFIRWYKGRVSHEVRKIEPDFRWQSRFYDRIIRDEAEFARIVSYIYENPFRWSKDEYS